ncbi:unnamed protein product [Penicillium glandicola]
MSRFTAQTFESPPPSRGPSSPQRQRLLRESEDTEGEMSIEQYIYRTNPFRSISFSNPDPRALKKEYLSIEEDPTKDLHREIHSVLDQHSLPSDSLFHIVKATLNGDQLHLLCVMISGDSSGLVRLGPIKEDLIQLLRQHNLSQLHVEVIDSDHFYYPALFPISAANGLVMAYENSKEEIVRLRRQSLGTQWQLCCPFNVGRDSHSAQPALVIFVKSSTKTNWFQIRDRLVSQVSPVSDVEFLPEMGHSIGIRGDKNAGTLGGYVELRHDNQTHRGLLTNYHVIRPSPPHELVEAFDRFGISPLSPIAHQTTITVESLAKTDRDFTIANINSQLDSLESRKADLTSYIENRLLMGEAPRPSSQQQLETLEASEERYFRANRMPEIPRNQKPTRRSSDQSATFVLPAGNPLMEFGSLQSDMYCIKKGRTTDVTGGVCNGAKAVFQIRYDIDGNDVDMKSHETEEYVILGVNGPFVEVGDSGSFVLDENGAVAGLLFADVWDGYNLAGVASTMPDIVDSMKLRLDGSVSLRLS